MMWAMNDEQLLRAALAGAGVALLLPVYRKYWPMVRDEIFWKPLGRAAYQMGVFFSHFPRD